MNIIQLTASPISLVMRLLNSCQKWVVLLLVRCFREKCTFWLSLEVVKIWIWILPFYLSGLKRDEAAFKHFIDKWELLHGQVYKSFSMSSEVKGKILPNPTPLTYLSSLQICHNDVIWSKIDWNIPKYWMVKIYVTSPSHGHFRPKI